MRTARLISCLGEPTAELGRYPDMALSIQILASGTGWSVRDVVCDYGPHDHSFVEEHAETAISAVTQATFQYRTEAGSATLVPGSLLLGNAGCCFECGHAYAQGDRCLAFHFAPAFFECIAAELPGVRTTTFACAGVPPTSELIGLLADAEVARDRRDAAALEEIATRLAGATLTIVGGKPAEVRAPSAQDERRITGAVRRIDAQPDARLRLNALAHGSAMSPYHFLRTFRQVTGMTPHQYILHARLRRAATRLRESTDQVSTIALRAGFKDLATFNRRFRRLIGTTPSAYRAAS
jgi:AraC family transcriptional regulator